MEIIINIIKKYTMLIALVVIVIFFQIMTKGVLLVPQNVSNLIFQNAYVVILAVGMLMCILTGGNIDLSVGAVVALIGAIAGTLIIQFNMNIYLSVAICIFVGVLIGAWQGFWIAYVRIPSFIVTLAGMLVFRGLTLIVLGGMTLSPYPKTFLMYSTGFIPDFLNIPTFRLNVTTLIFGILISGGYIISRLISRKQKQKNGYEVRSLVSFVIDLTLISIGVMAFSYTLSRYNGTPTVLVIIGLILLIYSFITNSTIIGRHIYAMGGNEKAAKLSGVKTNRMLFLAYVNMAVLATIAGLVFSARLNSASPQAGLNFELDAIAACFIGGASAYGGTGTIGGALIGALVMGVLNNGMSIMGVGSDSQMLVKGLVLLAAVAFDVYSKNKSRLS
jgi:putative multiple sugar transport system permease protein